MLEPGAKVKNERTGTEFELREISDAHFVLRYRSPGPTETADFAEHFHTIWTEKFHVISGSAGYRLGGDWHEIAAGHSVTLPPNVRHIHPMNVGPGPMVMDQVATLEDKRPRAAYDTLGVFFTLFEGHQEGRIHVDENGFPQSPLLFFAMVRKLTGAGGYDAAVSRTAQDFSGAILGRLAGLLGYEAIAPKWR